MIIADELDKKIVFSHGYIKFSTGFSAHTRQTIHGFYANISFERLRYVDFEGITSEAELEIYLFAPFSSSWSRIVFSKLIGRRYRFQELLKRVLELPVNPDLGFADNSIYLNGSHIPIDLTCIEFLDMTGSSIVARLDFIIKFEMEYDVIGDLRTSKIIELEMRE